MKDRIHRVLFGKRTYHYQRHYGALITFAGVSTKIKYNKKVCKILSKHHNKLDDLSQDLDFSLHRITMTVVYDHLDYLDRWAKSVVLKNTHPDYIYNYDHAY